MSLTRLALATTLLAAAARAAGAAGPTTVLGFPEVAGPHKDLQILGTSGDTTTYKLELDAIPEAPVKETWTVTVGPANIVAHGLLEAGPGTIDTVDRSCAIVKGSVLKECDQKVTAAKAGLTPEEEKEIEAANKLGPQPMPTEGAEAVVLVPLQVGPDATGGEAAAPGAAPGGAMGPQQTGKPMAPGGSGGAPSEGGEGSASGGSKKKDKKPDAGADGSPAGAATGVPPPASGTTNKSPQASNGAPPPAKQTTSGASRFGVTATVPLFLLGFAAVLVL